MFGTNLFFSALGAIRQSRRPAWRPVAVTALSLGALAALAGCGASSSPTATVPGQTVSATTLQSRFVAMVGAVSPAVVQIQSAEGLGSGVVFDAHGNVVTNAHVAANQTRFTVTLPSGKHYSATLVGADPASDLAVIHITSATPPAAAFATSSKARVGNIVLAIGNPLGLQSSVSEGIVSSLDRTVSEGNGVTLSSVIQTSAEINPGNSGGALVDLEGAVVGIPTLAAIDPEFGETPAPGIGFAIPSNTARNFATKLIASGSVAPTGRAYLGVAITTILTGGVLVQSVQPGGPAAKAGIKPGEVIVSVAGQQTASADVLTSVLATLRPGQTVPVQVLAPSGQVSTVQVKLGSQPGR